MFSALRRSSRSVSFRLTAWTSGFFFLSTVALMAVVYAQLYRMVLVREHEGIELRTGFLAAAYARGGVDAVAQYASRTGLDGIPVFFVEITTPDGRTLFASEHERWDEFDAGRAATPRNPSAAGGTAWSFVPGIAGPLQLGSRRLDDGNVLSVGRATAESRKVLRNFRQLSLVSLATVVPFAILTGGVLARRTLQPIRSLSETVQTIIETRRFSSRVPSSGRGDEVDELVLQFNEMLAHIETLMTGLSESLDHVAHDLRTPLTRLRNSAQSALKQSRDPDVLAEALADCLEEADRVLVTVRRLIELAAAEGRVAAFDREPLDLAALAVEAADLFEEIAEDREVAIRVVGDERVVVHADREAIRRVVSNLLDNAIKFTKVGTTVELAVEDRPATAEIRVIDHGDGITAKDLPHIWSRFFRGGSERPGTGAGLGLSIVKAVVEAHGGSVQATSEPGVKTEFIVRLPKSAAGRGEVA